MSEPITMDKLKSMAERQLKEIATFREQFQKPGMTFSTLPEKDVIRRLAATPALPQILGQGWTSGTTPGSQASYSVYISNPGTVALSPLFVTIFFGMANFAPDIIEAFAGRDQVWPYRTTQPFSLAAGANVTKTFQYVVPAGTSGSAYTGNAVLWRGDYHDVGSYCDRGLFDINIT